MSLPGKAQRWLFCVGPSMLLGFWNFPDQLAQESRSHPRLVWACRDTCPVWIWFHPPTHPPASHLGVLGVLLGLVGVLPRANSRALWLSPAMDFPQHSQHVLEQLNQQRQLGLLCDCTFVVDGVDFKAHKAVLAACSEYFKMLFVDQKDVVHLDISNAAGTPLGPGPSLWRAPCHVRPSFEQHLPAVGCARPPTRDSAMSAWVPSSYRICGATFDREWGGKGRAGRKGS